MTAPILVFGRSGQLARELALSGERTGRRIACVGRAECDLAGDGDPGPIMDAVRPAAVINAAGFTAVDRAESEPQAAFRLNRDAAGLLARLCVERNLPFVHVSTDYVFDGSKGRPYVEADTRSPLSVYGLSKAQGEDAVTGAGGVHAVVRTAWLWSVFGANFPKTMLRLARRESEVRVVMDQRGRPTSTRVAATTLLALADRLVAADPTARGVFHLSNAGDATWADVAEAIFALSAARGGPFARVRRIVSAEFPTPARRPPDSRLDAAKLETLLGACFPHWRDCLEAGMDELVAQQKVGVS